MEDLKLSRLMKREKTAKMERVVKEMSLYHIKNDKEKVVN